MSPDELLDHFSTLDDLLYELEAIEPNSVDNPIQYDDWMEVYSLVEQARDRIEEMQLRAYNA